MTRSAYMENTGLGGGLVRRALLGSGLDLSSKTDFPACPFLGDFVESVLLCQKHRSDRGKRDVTLEEGSLDKGVNRGGRRKIGESGECAQGADDAGNRGRCREGSQEKIGTVGYAGMVVRERFSFQLLGASEVLEKAVLTLGVLPVVGAVEQVPGGLGIHAMDES